MQVRVCKDKTQAICLSVMQSEMHKSVHESLSDSFITFLGKLSQLVMPDGKDSPAAFLDLQLKFNGAKYNLSMHKAFNLWKQCESEGLKKVLRDIEYEFGRDCLSSSYSKVYRLLAHSQKAEVADRSHAEISVAVAEHCLLALRTKRITAKGMTIELLDRHPKTSAPGLFQLWTAKIQACSQQKLDLMM